MCCASNDHLRDGTFEVLHGSGRESGFAYAPVSGSLYVSPNGRPGQDMEGDSSGGGVLGLTGNVAGGTFQFVRLDFSAYSIAARSP